MLQHQFQARPLAGKSDLFWLQGYLGQCRLEARHHFRNGQGDVNPHDSDNGNLTTRGVQVRRRSRRRCGHAGHVHLRMQVLQLRFEREFVQGHASERGVGEYSLGGSSHHGLEMCCDR